MSRGKLLLGLALVLVLGQISVALAEALIKPNFYQREVSRLFPILPPEVNLDRDANLPITPDIGNMIYDRCLSRVPERFTPDAHRYYCTCSTAATVGTITHKELKELQQKKSRVIGNATFEKYVTEVITPCMDVPVEQIEYLYCVLSTRNDPRIDDIPKFCGCVSAGMGLHFKEFGRTEMMIAWNRGNEKMYDDPVGGLWEDSDYQNARTEYRRRCRSHYTKPNPFKD